MTIRQLTQRKFLHAWPTGRNRQVSILQTRPLKMDAKESAPEWQTGLLPTRPDDTALSEAIPLFFVGRNRNGFWVARESAGRRGGLFLFRRSATRFARRNGTAGGGATMFVEDPIELDLPNQGSKLAELMAVMTNIVSCRAPRVAKFFLVR